MPETSRSAEFVLRELQISDMRVMRVQGLTIAQKPQNKTLVDSLENPVVLSNP